LVLKLGLEEKVLGGAEEKRAMASRAEGFSEQDLIRFFDMLLRLESELRWTSQARFHLEIGFIKLAKVGHVRDIEEVIREVKGGDRSGPSSTPPPASTPRAPYTPPKSTETVSRPAPTQHPPPSESLAFRDLFNRKVEEKSPIAAVYLHKAERV